MNINYIDIIIVFFMIINIVEGYKRGIFLSLIEFVRYIIGIPLCLGLAESLSMPLYENYFRQRALQSINQQITNTADIGEITSNISEALSNIPAFFTANIDTSFLNTSTEDISQAILVNVFEPIIIFAIKAGLFIISAIIFFTATKILVRIIKKSRRKKMQGKNKSKLTAINSIFGSIFGFLNSVVVVLVIVSVLKLVSDMGVLGFNEGLNEQLSNSLIINWLGELNPLDYLIGG